jgi:sigma-B regulation protein RsbU (phosphoserine phosphatase)
LADQDPNAIEWGGHGSAKSPAKVFGAKAASSSNSIPLPLISACPTPALPARMDIEPGTVTESLKMPIRWKLLILLLCISVGPILTLRTMSQRASAGLGHELALQEERTLVKRSQSELLRLVEDHARLAGREKSLLESLLILQAHAVQGALENPQPQATDLKWAEFGMGRMGMGNSQPLTRALKVTSGFTFAAPSSPSAAQRNLAARMVDNLDRIQAIARRHPDLVLRQITVFKNGLVAITPGPLKVPRMFTPARAPWYAKALNSDKPVWDAAHLDMLTRIPVMVAAVPVTGPDGQTAGVTAIVAKVETILQKGRHLQDISARLKSFLVRPTNKDGLEIVAAEQELPQGRHWWLPESPEMLVSPDKAELAGVSKSLRDQSSGVRELEYRGEPSIWAYGPANWEGMALLMIVPLKDLTAEAAAAKENVLKRVKEHIWSTSILVALALCAIVIIALIASRTVTLRLKKMAQAVQRLEAGDLSAQVDIKGKDEIGALGQAYNRMLPALRERLRLKRAMDLAQEVQASLLPEGDLDLPGLKVSGASRYCDETGGDFFDFIALDRLSEARYVLLAGDVTGHGAPAALLMTTTRAFLRAELGRGQDLASAITAANRHLCRDTFGSGRFVTLFALEVDLPGRNLRWVNAGQHPALLTCTNMGPVRELGGTGLPLGVEPDLSYESKQHSLQQDCRIIITTDGIPEALGNDEGMFGLERVKHCLEGPPLAPAQMIEQVFARVREHQAGKPQEDDYTLVAVNIEL